MKRVPDNKPASKRIARTVQLIKDKASGATGGQRSSGRSDGRSFAAYGGSTDQRPSAPPQQSRARQERPAAGPSPADIRFQPPANNEDITLRDVIGLVIAHRRWVAIVMAFFVMAALLYVSTRERPYIANSRILLDPLGIQVLDRDVLRRSESSDGGAAMVESHMRVMTSESVLRQVVISENLATDKEFLGGERGFLSTTLGAIKGLFKAEGKPTDPEIKALLKLQDAVKTARPQRSYIIDLHVKTKSAERSAHLANVIARTYIESEVNERSGLARRASGTLTARLAQLQAELSAAESAIERYKSDNNILETNGTKVNEQDVAQLNQLLAQASSRTTLAQSNLEQIETARATATDLNNIPEALSSSTISGLRIRLATALQSRSVLSAQLLPSHPNMTAANAQVEVISQQINQELNRIIGRAKAQVDRAQAEELQIEQRLDALKQTTFVTNDARVRLRELSRDADTKRAIYESFLLRARELGEQEGVDTNQARIISNALPPERPSGPSSILILAVALVLGLVAGILFALMRGYYSILMAPGPYIVPQAADRVSWPDQDVQTAAALPRPKRRTRPTRQRLEIPN